jgi:hypothetical protein
MVIFILKISDVMRGDLYIKSSKLSDFDKSLQNVYS